MVSGVFLVLSALSVTQLDFIDRRFVNQCEQLSRDLNSPSRKKKRGKSHFIKQKGGIILTAAPETPAWISTQNLQAGEIQSRDRLIKMGN